MSKELEIESIETGHDKCVVSSRLLSGIIRNLEYAAINLCSETIEDISNKKDGFIIQSTSPETSLLIAIRDLKELGK